MKKIFILLVLLTIMSCGGKKTIVEGETEKKVLSEFPVWPGCEGSNDERRACFQLNLAKHVQENFDSSIVLKRSDFKKSIPVTFIINYSGEVEILKIEGGSEAMRNEAKRIIMLIPKIKPGIIDGEPANVKFVLPFNIQPEKEEKKSE